MANPLNSPLFGDLIKPFAAKYENPKIIGMAYQKYLQTVTQPADDGSQTPPVAVMTPDEFKSTGQYYKWIPLLKVERTPVQAMVEAAKRAKTQVTLEQQIWERRMRGQDWEDIAQQLETHELLESVDPVKGILPATAGLIGGMAEPMLSEGLTGATAGAAAAAVGGQAGPQVIAPEEVVTVPAAAALGFSAGSIYGWYKQGSGAISYNLWKRGINTHTSNFMADLAAIPYALIDQMQVTKLIPTKFKTKAAEEAAQIVVSKWPDVVEKILPKMAKKYGETLTTEVLLETAQEGISMFAEDVATALSEQGINFDKQYFKERAERLLGTIKEATKGFALLPVVPLALNAYSEMQVDVTDLDGRLWATPDVTVPLTPRDALQDMYNRYKQALPSEDMLETYRKVTPQEIQRRYDDRIGRVQKLAIMPYSEFRKAYDKMDKREKEGLNYEFERAKMLATMVQHFRSDVGPLTQEDIDNAVASFVPLAEAKQVVPVLLKWDEVINLENNLRRTPYEELESLIKEQTPEEIDYAYKQASSTIKAEEDAEVYQKVYMKGFAARLTSIQNNADNMLVGAGDPQQQKAVMLEELEKLEQHYKSINDVLEANPDKLRELIEIRNLLPAYREKVESFLAGPSKEKFQDLRAMNKAIAQLGVQYRERMEATQQEAERVATPQPQPELDTPEVVKRVVSRFPAKIKDNKSLETVGNMIAKHLNVPAPDSWNYIHHSDIPSELINIERKFNVDRETAKYIRQIRREGGVGGFTGSKDGKTKDIYIVVGKKISKGEYEAGPGTAGVPAGHIPPSQAIIKKTVVHELGHIAKPAIEVEGKREAHHPEFVKWVEDSVNKLWEYQPNAAPSGQVKAGITTLMLPDHRDAVADVISGGREVSPDGTVPMEVTEVQAVNNLKLMLQDYTLATGTRTHQRKKLRSKQYAILSRVLDDYVGPESFIKAKKALEGIKMETAFNWAHPLNEATYVKLCDLINQKLESKWSRLNCFEALTALRAGCSIPKYQKLLLCKVFGLTPNQIPTFDRPWTFSRILVEAINFPRFVLAGFADNSTLLRQMYPAFWINNKLWRKSFVESMKAYISPEYAEKRMAEIYNSPNFEYYMLMNIDFTNAAGPIEEQAESSLGGAIFKYRPIRDTDSPMVKILKGLWNPIGMPFRASMRAADIAGNTFRANLADLYISINRGLINPDTAEGALGWKRLGNMINEATGRIHVEKDKEFKYIAAALNPLMFSMQLHTSRIALLATGTHATGEQLLSLITNGKFEGKYSPEVRKAISNSFLKMAFGTLATAGLLSFLLPGAVSLDPEESKFGKVKIGNTYYDLTAGFGQYVRFVAQMLSGKKRSITGNRYAVGRANILTSFMRSKASPALNIAWDALLGKKMTGEPVDWTSKEGVLTNLYNYFAPMLIQDTIDLMNNNPEQLLPGVAFAFFGGGMQSYPLLPAQQAVIAKKQLARETYGKDWDELGPTLQRSLYLIHPELEELDRHVKAIRTDWDTVALRAKESQRAGKEVLKRLPQDVQKELLSLDLTLGGFTRQIGSSSYFLNEERFKEYQDSAYQKLNILLPKVMNSPEYDKLNRESRVAIATALINKCKELARQEILAKVNQQDMLTLSDLRKGLSINQNQRSQ